MFTLLIVIALLLLAIAAPVWGADSRDGLDSAEFERRRSWRATR